MAARNNDRGAEGRPALDADNSVEFVVKVSQCGIEGIERWMQRTVMRRGC